MLIPFKVESQLAVVAPVAIIEHSTVKVVTEDFRILAHVTFNEPPRREQYVLRVALLAYLILECLLELLELHYMAFFFKVGDDAV